MYEGGIPINKAALPDQLARFFNSKIVELSNQLPVIISLKKQKTKKNTYQMTLIV